MTRKPKLVARRTLAERLKMLGRIREAMGRYDASHCNETFVHERSLLLKRLRRLVLREIR